MRARVLAAVTLVLIAGCPQPQTDDAPVTAVIGYSTSVGPAPLSVTFTGSASTSVNGGPLTYWWTFGDGSSGSGERVTHTFADPGRYTVELRVVDPVNEEGTARIDVRAAGVSATAVISADRTSGTAPLDVQFDGTGSNAPDDEIFDYYWDFGDGQTSRQAAPQHRYTSAGTYTVTLRVVTRGGVEDTTETTITVTSRQGALQFNGSSLATLLLTSGSFEALTLEAWVRAESDGGTVATLGSGALSVEVAPAQNTLRVRVGSSTTEATATGLADAWRHIAVTFAPGASDPNDPDDPNDPNAPGTLTVYLNGVPLSSAAVLGPIEFTRLTIGMGLRGRVAAVRLWSVARSDAEIAASWNVDLGGSGSGLVGDWLMDEGSGQSLNNRAGGPDGVLGSDGSVESADPAWSTEGPPI